MPDYGYIAENVARALGVMMFGVGSFSLFNPLEGARTFAGERTVKDEKDALFFPVVGGRNMALGASLLALSLTGQRKGVATAMAAMCFAGFVDIWWCYRHRSEKWSGHLIGTMMGLPLAWVMWNY